jgi:hypothetical protein
VSDLAVGDAAAEPGVTTYSVSTVVTQKQHVDGLPLGTRGGLRVQHPFPADGEYVFNGRLLRTVAEGYMGVEGPGDAASVHHHARRSADLHRADWRAGGPRLEQQNITISREEIDKRMTSPRIRVTAGVHEVGFTFIEQPVQERTSGSRCCATVSKRTIRRAGHDCAPGNIEGSVQRDRISSTPSRKQLFICTPSSAALETPCASKILSAVARRAFRRPVVDADITAPMAFYATPARRGVTSTPASAPGWRASSRVRRSCSDRSRIRPVCPPARRTASPISSWRAVCPSSSEQHPGRRAAEPGDCRAPEEPRCARSAGASHDWRLAVRRAHDRIRRAVAAAAQSGQSDAPTC